MRLYRLLMRLYPAAFRAEYGSELIAAFAARRRDASSLFARLMLWFDVLPDLIVTAALSHWDILRQDVRLAARSLRSAPGFTVTTILVAAIGIGANTAVFSVTDHVLVRPLPFPDAERAGAGVGGPDVPRLPAGRSVARELARLEAPEPIVRDAGGLHRRVDEPDRLRRARTRRGVADVRGHAAHARRPARARTLVRRDEEKPGAPGTLILSDSVWKMRFGADPNVLGRHVVLDGVAVHRDRRHARELFVPAARRAPVDSAATRGRTLPRTAAINTCTSWAASAQA